MSDFKRLEEKVDKLDTRLDSIDATLIKNTILLDEHIKRTNILEEELRPVKQHVTVVSFVSKALLAIIPILLTIKKLFF